MFGKKKEKTTKKLDKLVTGVIIGSAIASIFGLSKTKKGQEVKENITKKSKGIFSRVYENFGKIMCKVVSKSKK